MERPDSHPVTRFLRRRLERGVPYGLGFTLAFVAIAAFTWGFAQVIDAVADEDDLSRWDSVAHDAVYAFLGGNDQLGLAITWFGNSATLTTLVVLVALGLVVAKRYWAAFRVVFASGVGGLVVTGLKLLFARDRPLEQVVTAHGYSFPSGHAFGSTVFYGMMVYLVWRLTKNVWARTVAVLLGPLVFIAVGLSRVFLNVHYLTDVVGGWLSGGAWLLASLLLVDVIETRTRTRREQREEVAHPDDADPQPHPAPHA